VDPEAEIELMNSYAPYGDLISSEGSFDTPYGYTGELTDSSGRFISKDTWVGDYQNPITLGKWLYANANPVMYTDPSGNYVYDREGAVRYAMAWDYQAGIDPKYDISKVPDYDWTNQCTLFASSVLYENGVTDPRPDPNPEKKGKKPDINPPYWEINNLMTGKWENLGYSGQNSWYSTPSFYQFVKSNIGQSVLTYNNPPQYTESSIFESTGLADKNWESILQANRSSIQKGNLVFYGNGETDWNHVAIVVGWVNPTHFRNKIQTNLGMFLWHQGMKVDMNIKIGLNRYKKVPESFRFAFTASCR